VVILRTRHNKTTAFIAASTALSTFASTAAATTAALAATLATLRTRGRTIIGFDRIVGCVFGRVCIGIILALGETHRKTDHERDDR